MLGPEHQTGIISIVIAMVLALKRNKPPASTFLLGRFLVTVKTGLSSFPQGPRRF